MIILITVKNILSLYQLNLTQPMKKVLHKLIGLQIY